MRIIFHTEEITATPGGATVTMIEYLEALSKRGHEVRILARSSDATVVAGFPVTITDDPDRVRDIYHWTDVVFAIRRAALQHIREYRRWHEPHGYTPITTVYFSHNIGQPARHGYSEDDVDLLVYNADWVRDATPWNGETLVIHPPIHSEKYITSPGEKITLINLARKKGGTLFWEIARMMPERQFLGVIGQDGGQILPPKDKRPTNVEVVRYSSSIVGIYSRTRILLVPSQGWTEDHRWGNSHWTESYGRVAVEAALSGIPVLAFPTPGLKEALGPRAIYPERDAQSWVDAIRALDAPEAYFERSRLSATIADEIDPAADIERLVSALTKIAAAGSLKRHHTFFDVAQKSKSAKFPTSKRVALQSSRTVSKIDGKSSKRKVDNRRSYLLGMKKLIGRVTPLRRDLFKTVASLPEFVLYGTLAKLLPKKPGSVLVMAPESGYFLDNAKYAYIALNRQTDLTVKYLTYHEALAEDLRARGVNALNVKGLRGALALLRAKVIVGTAIYPFRGKAGHLGSGGKLVQLWHGAGLKQFGLNRPSNVKKKDRLVWRIIWRIQRMHPTFDVLYLSSEKMRQERQGSFKHKMLKINGLLRNDLIVSPNPDGLINEETDQLAVAAISAAKHAGKKLILYAPTFRRPGEGIFNEHLRFEVDDLNAFLEARNALMVVKYHPKTDEHRDIRASSIIEYDKNADIYPSLGLFDILVTDVSSIFTDYALTGRPVLFYAPDPRRIEKCCNVSRETIERLPGQIARDYPALKEILAEAISSPSSTTGIAEEFHSFNDGKNTARFVEDVRKLALGLN